MTATATMVSPVEVVVDRLSDADKELRTTYRSLDRSRPCDAEKIGTQRKSPPRLLVATGFNRNYSRQ
jgi:hypothetical protein